MVRIPKNSGAEMATIACCFVLFLAAATAQGQTFSIIHSFTGGADGATPDSTLAIDAAGNLYGTAARGGNSGENCDGTCGVVFKLKRSSSDWVLTPLYAFNGGADGSAPGSVGFGPDGTLYGATGAGGISCSSDTQYGCGTVFNLRPSPTACKSALCPWSETVLYRFTGGPNDRAEPNGSLVFD